MAKKAVPTNPALYARAKAKVKRRVKKWPSAYSSAQLVLEYRRMGGSKPRKGLVKWFREDWRDISTKDKSGKHPKCGRPSGSKRGYPKCVPASKAASMSAKDKKRATARKRATNPSRGKKPTYVRT